MITLGEKMGIESRSIRLVETSWGNSCTTIPGRQWDLQLQ